MLKMKATWTLLLVCLIAAVVRLNQGKTLPAPADDDGSILGDVTFLELAAFKKAWSRVKHTFKKMNKNIEKVFNSVATNLLPSDSKNTTSKVENVGGAKVTTNTTVWKHKTKDAKEVGVAQTKVMKGKNTAGIEQIISSMSEKSLKSDGKKTQKKLKREKRADHYDEVNLEEM